MTLYVFFSDFNFSHFTKTYFTHLNHNSQNSFPELL